LSDDRLIRASLVQLDVIPLCPSENCRRILKYAEEEALQGADLVVFPELSNTGYVEPLAPGAPFVTDTKNYAEALYAACSPVDGPIVKGLEAISVKYGTHFVIGLGLQDPVLKGVMRNSALLIGPGGIISRYDKVHLWHNEKLYFTCGDRIRASSLGGVGIGMQICYDIRFPEVTRTLTLQGAEIIVSVWASFGEKDRKIDDEDLFLHRSYTRSIENGIFFLSCNRSGVHGNHRFFGRSLITAPDGHVVVATSSDTETILRATLDMYEVVRYRSSVGILADRKSGVYMI